MKIFFTVIFFFLNLTNIFGQDIKEIFKSNKYQKKDYPKFNGKIEISKNIFYHFGDKILKISLENKKYEKFFSLGIFNPDVLFGKETIKQTKEATFDNFFRTDSLAICCFEEMKKLNPNSKTKRFKFWVFRTNVANPTEYYIEFYNEKANRFTSIEQFIENSKMTFFYKGAVII